MSKKDCAFERESMGARKLCYRHQVRVMLVLVDPRYYVCGSGALANLEPNFDPDRQGLLHYVFFFTF